MKTLKAIVPGNLLDGNFKTEAIFSDCMAYRYYLEWRWSDAPALYVCMLNPSTADQKELDTTIKGLVKRAKLWGYGAVIIINLFAFRATKPPDMLAAKDPVGPDNDLVISMVFKKAMDDGSPIICGWGKDGNRFGRNVQFVAQAEALEVKLMALEINQDNTPKHPLYIKHEIRPSPWP